MYRNRLGFLRLGFLDAVLSRVRPRVIGFSKFDVLLINLERRHS